MAPRATVPHKDIRRFDSPSATEQQFLKGRYFPAACPATVEVRHFVRITGPAIAGVRQVDVVDPYDLAKMPAAGVVIEKPSSTTCLVQIQGEANGGLFPGLTPNGRYWVGADAKATLTPPSPLIGGSVYQQLVGMALGSTILLVVPNQQLVEVKDGAVVGPRADAEVNIGSIVAGSNVRGGLNTDAMLLNYAGLDFKTRVVLQLNGVTLRNGDSAGDGHDCYPGTNPSLGDVKFTFTLREFDILTMVLLRDLQNLVL